jgi:hypothetical protein
MINVLTILSKLDRVSRVVDPASFSYNPGQWADLDSEGGLVVPANGVPAVLPQLILGNPGDNVYEGHDLKVGRITTIEGAGVRVSVDGAGFAGTVNQGDLLYVSADSANKGKLVALATITAPGWYVAVAKAQQITAGVLTYVTLSPVILTQKS